VEPDVLIIDEALSVGDGYFQKKCMDRLRLFVESGGTLLFCSHAMYYVSAFCQRALWLRHGRAEGLGPVADVVRDYENFLVAKSAQAASQSDRAATEAFGVAPAGRPGMPARIAAVRLVEPGTDCLYRPGDDWELEVAWETGNPHLGFHLGVGINRVDGVEVCSFATHLDGKPPLSGDTRYAARLRIPALPLVKGEFTLYVFLLDEEGLHIYDQRVLPNVFTVHSQSYSFGLVRVDHAWDLDAATAA
jgi:lipopolysaccharide transport system ATP-binding protein